jgi:hypothetical protein
VGNSKVAQRRNFTDGPAPLKEKVTVDKSTGKIKVDFKVRRLVCGVLTLLESL